MRFTSCRSWYWWLMHLCIYSKISKRNWLFCCWKLDLLKLTRGFLLFVLYTSVQSWHFLKFLVTILATWQNSNKMPCSSFHCNFSPLLCNFFFVNSESFINWRGMISLEAKLIDYPFCNCQLHIYQLMIKRKQVTSITEKWNRRQKETKWNWWFQIFFFTHNIFLK